MQVKVLIIMQFRTIWGDDCHVVSCMLDGHLWFDGTLVAEFIEEKFQFRI